MATSWSKYTRRIITGALTIAVALGAIGSPAMARPAGSEQEASRTEPGWPASHFPENDPRPGDPGYLAVGPAAVPREGMTDAEFRAKDPAAYVQVVRERASIERRLLAQVRTRLAREGIAVGRGTALTADEAKRAETVLAATTYSPFGYLRFTLVPNTTSPYARNGYLGTLYFIYGIYSATTDSYKWFTVSWPARSGDNRPYNQSIVGVGPIPAYTWDFGFMYGDWRGYEADGRVEFYPGKWRLDPWTGGPYGRAYLEVHGGSGVHEFAATSGCIRVYPAAVTSLRSYYTYKMANKYDAGSAHLYVRY